MASDSYYMGLAQEAAREGVAPGEVPLGAMMVAEAGEILARAFNRLMAFTGPIAPTDIFAAVLVAGVGRIRNIIELSIGKVTLIFY